MKRALFPLILIFLVFSLLPSVTASHLTVPPSSTPVITPTPSTSVITWSQPTPLRAPVRVALNMDTVWALVVDPQSPGTIYIGTSEGICKSEDKGGTWRTITGLPSSEVPALAVDPQETDTLYASFWGRGVFKSTDGGVTWRAASEGLTNFNVQTLALEPGAPDTIYAGTYGEGVFKSTDSGATWQAYNEGLAADTKVLALAVDPRSSDTVYMGTAEKGVFKSKDGGWPAVNKGLTNRNVWALAVNSVITDTVYAGTSGGVFKSTNGGDTWRAVNKGLTNRYVRALALNPEAPDMVYAGTREGGVFKSTDGGDTWQAIGKGLTSTIAHLAVDPQMPDTIYAGTHGEGVFRSTDGGATWEVLTEGLIATNVVVLAIDPQTPATVYGGTSGGVFKSSDGGVTWQMISESLASRDVQALTVAPQAVGTVYVGTSGGVFKSSDGGDTWQEVNEGLTNRYVRTLAVDPQSSGTVYAGIWQGGVFKSVDGAATWQSVNEGLTNLKVWTLALNPLSPATVYVGTLGGGVFKSVDGAATWQAVNEGLTNLKVQNLTLDPQSPDTVYAGTEEALFKSDDGGLSWQRLFSRKFISLSVDPLISQVLYTATGTGVNLSRDGGVSWEEIKCPDAHARLLILNPSDPQTIYGAAGETGVFRGGINRALLSPSDNWLLPLVSFSSVLPLFLAWVYAFVARPNRMPFAMALRLLLAPRQLVLAIGGGYMDRNWSDWQHSIESSILHRGRATTEALSEVPHQFQEYALNRYYQEHKDTMLINRGPGGAIKLENVEQITAFFQKWEEAAVSVDASQGQFANLAIELANQLGKLGFLQETNDWVHSQGTLHGLMVTVPPLEEPEVPPSFPLIFIRQRGFTTEDVDRIQKLKMAMGAVHTYFAFLFAFDRAERVKEITKRTVYDVDFIVFDKELLYHVLTARDRDRALAQTIAQQASLKRVSPYVVYGPVPLDKVFFGREREINAIISAVKEASIALVGGRKIGKTSTLDRAARSLEKRPDMYLLRLDYQKISDYAGFFDKLRALPEIQGIPITEDNNPLSFEGFVTEVQKRVPDRRIVFVMDEVDGLLKKDKEETLFGRFRSLSQEKRCSFVLCGAKVLHERLHASWSVLFNFCDTLILSYLDRESAAKIVTDPMRKMGITLKNESSLVPKILSITSGHPNLIQFLCHTTLEYIDREGKRNISLEDILKVSETDEFREFVVEVMWGDASPLEKIITLLLVEKRALNEHEIHRGLQEKGIPVTINQLKQALKGLQLYSILTKRGGQFVFVAEFFPQIIGASQDQVDWWVEEFLWEMKEA